MMYSQLILAQTTSPVEEAHGMSEIVVVGSLFVVLVLVLMAAVTAVVGALFARNAARSAEQARRAAESMAAAKDFPAKDEGAPAAAAPAESSPEDDSAMVAVIAAAVHSVFGDRPHRVVSIRHAGPGWAQEGRRQIFSSHRVR